VPPRTGRLRGAEVANGPALPRAGLAVASLSLRGACPQCVTVAFVYGEAAMQLWYNQYEESLVERSLCRARDLLREALDAGYENARIYVALALTEAALGDAELAETTLRKLARKDVDSWLDVIEEAQQSVKQSEYDALAQAFALGITESSVWNALGTYSAHFLEDDGLAVQLYQIGRRLGPKDPIILTNLARVLIRLGGSTNLAEAKRLLQQAGAYADRGFTWWRDVVRQMNEAQGRKRKPPRQIPLRQGSRVRRKDIQRLFEVLDSGQYEVQERGYAFERLFVNLLRITSGVYDVKGKHSVGSPSFEVDAAFTYDEIHYRVELKWRKKCTDLPEIATFEKALETAGVAGLFVSMSGYTDRAIEMARDLAKTRRILLVDGEEIRAVVYGGLGFQTLLEKKQSHFLTYGEPYVRTHNKSMVGVRSIESDSTTARPQRE
jgi:hypothetical protein